MRALKPVLTVLLHALLVVKPQTVVACHRKIFQQY